MYTLYGGELSLFTRKLQAALLFYGAPYEFIPKAQADGEQLEIRSGTHQVPVLKTPENWVIADTTPIMSMLDGRFPGRRMFPVGAPGLLVHILEEHLDEWIARVMVHYRWHYADSARFASMKIALGNAEAAARVAEWGPRACRATGTGSEQQQRAAEAEYVRLLEAAEAQLKDTAYLLGDRPTAVDCMVLGGLRAHTYMDPDPKKVVAGFPTVVEWTERRADQWTGDGDLAPLPDSTPFARHLLSEMADTYVPFVLGNREAQLAGAKAFHAQIYGEEVSYLTRSYPEQSRQMVVDRVENLAGNDDVESLLTTYKLTQAFAA